MIDDKEVLAERPGFEAVSGQNNQSAFNGHSRSESSHPLTQVGQTQPPAFFDIKSAGQNRSSVRHDETTSGQQFAPSVPPPKSDGANPTSTTTPRPAASIPATPPIPGDLLALIQGWQRLPDALKAGINAMIQTTESKEVLETSR